MYKVFALSRTCLCCLDNGCKTTFISKETDSPLLTFSPGSYFQKPVIFNTIRVLSVLGSVLVTPHSSGHLVRVDFYCSTLPSPWASPSGLTGAGCPSGGGRVSGGRMLTHCEVRALAQPPACLLTLAHSRFCVPVGCPGGPESDEADGARDQTLVPCTRHQRLH